MKIKLLILTLAILLACASVSAVTTNYETSSVARIVGNSIADLQAQINHQDMNLKHATNSVSIFTNGDVSKPAQLYSMFKDNVETATGLDILDSGEYGVFEKDEFLIHKAGGSATSTSTKIDGLDKQGLEQQAQNGNILFMSDADYSGLYLRKIDMANKNILTKTPTIAPTYRRSSLFSDAFVCNMALWGDLGEVYRNARNAYYKNAGKNEFLGLTLMSYHLFGNPLIQINTPSTTLSTSELTKYCQGLLADTEARLPLQQFSTESADNSISREYALDLSNYNLTTENNQTSIDIPGGALTARDGELYLPSLTVSDTFPDKTIITSVSDPIFANPVDINVAGTPIWNGLNLQDQCFADQQDESFEKSHATTDKNEEQVIMNIIPFKVINCTTRNVRLYQSVSFTIDYTPYSPLLIEDIKATAEDLPEAIVPIQISLKSMQDSPEEGYLRIMQNNTIVSLWPINSTDTNAIMNLTLPDTEGTWDYTLDFYEGNTTRTSRDFQIKTRTLTSEIQPIETPRGATTATLTVNNPSTRELDSTISYELSNSGTDEKNSIDTKLKPGDNEIALTFSALEPKAEAYYLTATTIAEDKSTTAFSTIVTDYAPTIENENIIVNEGDSVNLLPNASDSDGDTTTDNLDAPFTDKTFSNDESGIYFYTIESSDGIKSSQKTFSIIVLNVNQQPWLNVSDSISGKENSTIKINAVYGDPDNENSDLGDNNNLTIAYGYPFDNNGTWTPTFDDGREYNVDVTVDDGELHITKTVNVSIANTNRAPIITVYNQTTSEGAAEIKTISVTDPDNANAVSNDDNNLTIICKGDTINKISANVSEECAVSYPYNYTNSTKQDIIAVSASDGELTTQDNAYIQVNNTNRPPVITQNNINVTEGDIVKATPEITDPDNTNGNENTLITTYGGVLNATGEWRTTTEDSGTHVGTIIVSDGITQTTKDITINVKNFNRPPVISNLANITAKEGDTITLNPIITDPDNQNNVTTDDQNITTTISQFFINNIWNTNYDQSGEYDVNVTASDGESTITQKINIIIQNVNRPPTYNLITTAKENSTAILISASDIDNENNVSNDDTPIILKCNPPANENCTMPLSFSSAGNYTISGTISDGIATFNETWNLNVDNVNRLPKIISIVEPEAVGINENASLTVFASDDDGDPLIITWSGATDEGTQITDDNITFSSAIFESKETAGDYITTAQISDGIDIINQTFITTVIDHAYIRYPINIHSRFNGDTTNLSTISDFSNVSNFVLDKSEPKLENSNSFDFAGGKIEFLEPVDLTKAINLANVVYISGSLVFVDSDLMPGLNKTAKITLYDVPNASTYILRYSPKKSAKEDSVICPPDICTDTTKTGTDLSFIVPHFSSFFLETSNKQAYELSMEDINYDITEQEKIELIATITNSGALEQNNIELSTTLPAAIITPSKVNLKPGGSALISIKAPASKGTFALHADGNSDAESKIVLNEHDILSVSIRAKGKGDLTEGASITKDLGDIVELKVTVKNNAKNTTLFIPTIQGTLSGLDEEQSDEQDITELLPGEEDTVTLRLPLPLLSEDSNGNINLEILAQTDKGEEYNYNGQYKIKIDKENHDLKLDLTTDSIQCGKEFNVVSIISNIGKSDEDTELTISAFNSTQITNISISEGERNTITTSFIAPNKTSNEILKATLSYSGKSTTNNAPLILNCGDETRKIAMQSGIQTNTQSTSALDTQTDAVLSDENKILIIITVGLLIILFGILLITLIK